jgi:hypothetical protein
MTSSSSSSSSSRVLHLQGNLGMEMGVGVGNESTKADSYGVDGDSRHTFSPLPINLSMSRSLGKVHSTRPQRTHSMPDMLQQKVAPTASVKHLKHIKSELGQHRGQVRHHVDFSAFDTTTACALLLNFSDQLLREHSNDNLVEISASEHSKKEELAPTSAALAVVGSAESIVQVKSEVVTTATTKDPMLSEGYLIDGGICIDSPSPDPPKMQNDVAFDLSNDCGTESRSPFEPIESLTTPIHPSFSDSILERVDSEDTDLSSIETSSSSTDRSVHTDLGDGNGVFRVNKKRCLVAGKGHESTDSGVFSYGSLGGHQSAVSGEGIQVQVQVKSQEQVQVMKKMRSGSDASASRADLTTLAFQIS